MPTVVTFKTWKSEMESYLIDLISEYKHLWDVRDPMYTKKNLKHQTYKRISNKLTQRWPEYAYLFTHEGLVSKFQNLRTYYQREKKKYMCKSGSAGPDSMSKWKHYSKMQILDGDITARTEIFDKYFPEFVDNDPDMCESQPENLSQTENASIIYVSREIPASPVAGFPNSAPSVSTPSASGTTANEDSNIAFGRYVGLSLKEFSNPLNVEKAKLEISNILYSLKHS